jgi:ureidoglycolate hydrolase
MVRFVLHFSRTQQQELYSVNIGQSSEHQHALQELETWGPNASQTFVALTNRTSEESVVVLDRQYGVVFMFG